VLPNLVQLLAWLVVVYSGVVLSVVLVSDGCCLLAKLSEADCSCMVLLVGGFAGQANEAAEG